MSLSIPPIAKEFDLPSAHGFTMKGWDFTSAEIEAAISGHRMLNPAMELCTNICPWNCDFCFTESPGNVDGRKMRLAHELSIERRLELIDEVAELGARSVNFVGAGEPTIDPNFWRIVEKIRDRGMTPIIYTEGSLKLKERGFAERLFASGATVVLKVNSLTNADYQDGVLRGVKSKPGVPQVSYTKQRQLALDNLLDIGFNRINPTRLAFDTIICRENLGEIEQIHRFARKQNIFVIFVNFLPSGRTSAGHAGAVSWQEQHTVFRRLAQIDEEEYGLKHATHFPYAGGVPCTIRGLGMFLKIQGDVYDCPGETKSFGNVGQIPLREMWEQARIITAGFNGECFPRQQFWKRMAAQAERQNAGAIPQRRS